MTTNELIQKLQKIEASYPGAEIQFFLRELGPELKGFLVGCTDITKSRTAEGLVVTFQLATNRILPE